MANTSSQNLGKRWLEEIPSLVQAAETKTETESVHDAKPENDWRETGKDLLFLV